jgi:hypothetical protein
MYEEPNFICTALYTISEVISTLQFIEMNSFLYFRLQGQNQEYGE